MQLLLSFIEIHRNELSAVYSQYLRNDDDRIFVDTDEIRPETPDPLDNLRDYLETVVEIGNKKFAKYMKKLESDE